MRHIYLEITHDINIREEIEEAIIYIVIAGR
jgi:hypothetical protein